MKKWIAIPLFALALWSIASPSPAIAADVTELRVISVNIAPDSTVYAGPKGMSPGDMNLWSEPLYDSSEKEQVGTSSGYCVQVDTTDPIRQCSFTLTMKNGSVYVASRAATKNGPFDGAIIGGTGEYAAARGEVKYSPSGDQKKWTYDLKISK